MQKLVALLLIAVLAGSVTIPNVFSDEEQNNNQSNTQENENDDHGNQNKTKPSDDNDNEKDNKTKMHFGFSNATSFTVTLPNGTSLTFGFSNGTNPGQQISNFIHQIREAFKQQEDLAKKTIKDCREKAKDATNPADKKNIMDQCKIQLKQINQQFKSEHKQLQLDFKQFREAVNENNKENHEKPKDNDTKIKNTALVIPPHVPEKPHGKNSTQNIMPPKPHEIDEKQKHPKPPENQKPGKKD
ncbi:MAG TPA: hypothetical protein VFV16_03710 [Candidatus Nitrosotalea sp.]|jgi:hypothetical protein|nr:hypothetical protein [Candidatus Nitrosotalea sp.]